MPVGIVTDYEMERENEFPCFSLTVFLQQETDVARRVFRLAILMFFDYAVALKCSWNHFISYHLSFFKITPIYNYTLPLPTVKVMETFLEAILLESIQLFRSILSNVSSNTKATPFRC